jgi:hypothetical protein
MKIHQIWQRFNMMAIGWVIGQSIRMPDNLTIVILLMLALFASTILEPRFDKKDVSNWRNG